VDSKTNCKKNPTLKSKFGYGQPQILLTLQLGYICLFLLLVVIKSFVLVQNLEYEGCKGTEQCQCHVSVFFVDEKTGLDWQITGCSYTATEW
jgi:hypothetical protein